MSQNEESLRTLISEYKGIVAKEVAVQELQVIDHLPRWEIPEVKIREDQGEDVYLSVDARPWKPDTSIHYIFSLKERRILRNFSKSGDYTLIRLKKHQQMGQRVTGENFVSLIVYNNVGEVYKFLPRIREDLPTIVEKITTEAAEDVLAALVTKDPTQIEKAYIKNKLLE